ncbi:hypothetical protein SAMN05421790_104261 [Kroppenstedtia eburnea]|uniref:Transposase n=1 Tax=Kroppenstedtia eburnea TaxID=714067 RepID=A0A1N7LM13_9BACL|nr:hypothetical protein SAMN05421790_104261 [Kroppenstedtia eburnea]
MKRRQWSSEEKVAIALEGLKHRRIWALQLWTYRSKGRCPQKTDKLWV